MRRGERGGERGREREEGLFTDVDENVVDVEIFVSKSHSKTK